MRILKENRKHEEIPTEKITCDKCESLLEITQEDIKTERTHVYWSLFKKDVDYIICPVCGNKMYRIPYNYFTRTCHYPYYGE